MTVTDQIKAEKLSKMNHSMIQTEKQLKYLHYELLTGEDLGLKPSTIEQAKFEYSPLGKIFNKGLSEDDKKEGLLKRLKNIEDTNKVNKVKNKDIIEVTDFVNQPSSSKGK